MAMHNSVKSNHHYAKSTHLLDPQYSQAWFLFELSSFFRRKRLSSLTGIFLLFFCSLYPNLISLFRNQLLKRFMRLYHVKREAMETMFLFVTTKCVWTLVRTGEMAFCLAWKCQSDCIVDIISSMSRFLWILFFWNSHFILFSGIGWDS